MRALLLAVILSFGLALSAHAQAPEPTPWPGERPFSPRQIARGMQACLPITQIGTSDIPTWAYVEVQDGPEGFFVGINTSGLPPNTEFYPHWSDQEIELSFPRYSLAGGPPVPWRELRAFRNRVILCYFSVPPIEALPDWWGR